MNTIGCALIRPLAAGLTLLALTAGSARGAELIDGGFETGAYVIGGRPVSYGMWQGDWAEIVPAANGVIPFEGSEMIRLIHTTMGGPTERLGAEAWQLIDLTPDAQLVATGRAIARASAWFNRVTGDAETDTEFTITIRAYAGAPESFPQQWQNSELAMVDGQLFSDGDTTTWQKAEASLRIPRNADFLVIRVRAWENVFNDLTGVEFDGHFVDAVSLRIAGRPVGGGDPFRIVVRRFVLQMAAESSGMSLRLSVDEAKPLEMVYFAYSAKGAGVTYVAPLATVIELSRPQLIGSTLTDVNGHGEMPITLGQHPNAGTVWIQAIQKHALSNVIVMTLGF